MTRAIAAGDGIEARISIDELRRQGIDPLEQLAEVAAAGDDLATELLVECLDSSALVRKFVAGMLLEQSAIDDVSQDTLISVATSIGSFSGRSKFSTWVHRIARNRVVDHLRRRRNSTPLHEGHEGDLGPTARLSSVIATRVSVQRALEGLPEIYRVPVSLRDVDGLTYAQIGQSLGRRVGTVKSQVSRGRAMLAGRLEGRGGF